MIVTQRDFCMFVEDRYANNEMSMIDNVLYACEKFNVDPEMIEPLINRSVKEKIKREYVKLNYLKETNHVII
jgi:chorismate mutase